MIVVTVGMQLPFDRLIRMMDELAPELGEPIYAQTGVGTYAPAHFQARPSASPVEFETVVRDCRVMVAHAGIGTVLKAYKYGKPIILVPRQVAHGEHRNDHQLATVSQLRKRVGIYVADSTPELSELLKADLQPAVVTEEMEARRARFLGFIRAEVARPH